MQSQSPRFARELVEVADRSATGWPRGINARLIRIMCALFAASWAFPAQLPAEPVNYLKSIKPLLAEKCYSCHGVLKQEASLRLETLALMLENDVIVPGSSQDSELLNRIVSDDDDLKMPPPDEGAALSQSQIDLVRRWLDEGAEAPEEDPPAAPDEHWAYQTIQSVSVPRSSFANPIDALLDTKQQELRLTTTRPATRPIRLRRLYLDLVGLPPTREQLDDRRQWELIVDELLASPQHGERWARHWMDVWRYSEGYGLGQQLRYSQHHLWHWRDWIVRSLNDDKGYDRMVQEMLAGDELAPNDLDAVTGTGFLARHYYLFNRTTWLDSTIEHTAKAFLGMTMNCAKCHDHKYDPITQVDYYRFRAIFEPHQIRLDPIEGSNSVDKNGLPRAFDDQLDTPTYLHIKGDPKNPDESQGLTAGVPALLADFASEPKAIELPTEAFAPGTREATVRDRTQAAKAAVASAKQKLDAASDEQQASAAAALEVARAKLDSLLATVAADRARYIDMCGDETLAKLAFEAKRRQTIVLLAEAKEQVVNNASDDKKRSIAKQLKEDYETKLELLGEFDPAKPPVSYASLKVSKKALQSPAHKYDDYPAVYSSTSSGRRLALAQWITSAENPLTARVAVNHVWLRHFGRPLVESVFDFGLRAPEPVHADVLDYLAMELIRSGWSLKHLHRLIVTSQAYQRSSSPAAVQSVEAQAMPEHIDPTNDYYWRANHRRMESQVVRDSLLHLAGHLQPNLGGPSVDPNGDLHRRSLYLKHSRDEQNKFLSMFDDADILQCYRRQESIVPQQALALSNSKLAIDMSAKVASQLTASLDQITDHEFVRQAFYLLLARYPDENEAVACQEFILAMQRLPALAALNQESQTKRVRSRLIQSLLNHNDFVTIR
ncbi:PSD1 and planctomycete cytochrome C domain-containing protein [Roseiconus lacunae]|uniref:PSD1 and planctomycete cytochrome C domain-containing protein n=1 Tax=Roseiconus lacunae TaxID=2605694 RepID=UPI001E483DF1|nr:PSD1 and planctomycete cytochrome C domain-containing protein [Roseiconus lacunae]